ncbi:class I adenylate-forming enzyme family protein [Saccharopolyspora sp. CA-218241]|uniref:class I adenylate-forming enzyme family protein n=1 Tax=Saccharopolyspora sp. CA-218241 TaxID=3240027 RepID=UPI003D95C143
MWTSTSGLAIGDRVPPELRAEWVRRGDCPGRDVHALFTDGVRRHPHRAAVIDADGVLDYAGLDREVRRVAAALTRAGLGERDVVGIRLPNGRRMVVAELAVAAIGAVALPYPAGRGSRDTTSLLGRSRATGAIFGARDDAAEAAALPHLRAVRTFGAGPGAVSGDGPELDAAPEAPDWRAAPVDPEAPVRILVTSGSEAEPKMIAYSHNAMAGGRANYVRALHQDGPMRALVLMPLASSYGSLASHVGIAALGATIVLPERFDPAMALALAARHRITHLFGVPTMLRRLAEHPDVPELPALRAVVSSSAPLPEVTARRCTERFGRPVISVYGSSDGINCHTAATGPDPAAGTGRPDPAVAEIRVVDPAGRPVPPGEPGEIQARGPMTPLCYVAAPELDARYRTGDGWVRSGDRGFLDERGRLHVLGRIKQVVVRGGYNISPAEVEREIGAHPAVVEVACVPVPDEDLGERLCACISQVEGTPELTLPELTAFLESERGLERRKLPELLLLLPGLPVAPTGKVCRRTTAALAEQRTTEQRTTAKGTT